MGFSGGGSNILKPHTHDSNILQDGGNLDFKNITQGDMSAGSITYSDGSHLQELAIGTPAQNMRVNGGATALEYYTTPADVGQLVLLTSWTGVSGTSPAFSANMETTYSDLLFVANLYWITPYTEFGDCYLQLNGVSSGYGVANGYSYDSGSMTSLTKSVASVAFVSDAAMSLSSGEGMHIETTIAQIDGTTNMFSFHSLSNSSSGTSVVLDTSADIGSSSIITGLHLQASLAGWAAGSNFAIFGRKFT